MILFSVNFLPFSFLFFSPALPHTSSYSLMMGGFGGANIQKAQSLIDLGSSRYVYTKLPTFYAFNKEYLIKDFFLKL